MTLLYPYLYHSLTHSFTLLPLASYHNHIMPNSPTPNAPKDYDELIKLLENDTKVKVAGELRSFNGEIRAHF